jgi:uncharacterized protein (TIGR02996 family)
VLAFLAAVKESPEDDTPRLVLADWLQEHGDATDQARGEFIRVQCQLARLPAADPRRGDLARRERELLDAHAPAWLGPLWGKSGRFGFRRGLHHAYVIARTLLSRAFGQLLASGTYAWVEGLTLWGGGKTSNMLPRFVPFLRGLVYLGLESNRLGVRDTSFLTKQPELASLIELRLTGNPIGLGGTSLLASCPHLGRLGTLAIQRADLNLNAGRALAGSPGLSRLHTLDLGSNVLRDSGLAALGAWPHPGTLRALHLAYNGVSHQGVGELAASPLLPALSKLDLSVNTGIGDEGARILAEAPGASRLSSLALASCNIRDEGALALAASPHLAGLTHLNLHGNALSDRAVLALADSPHLGRLTSLELSRPQLGPLARDRLRERFGP